MFSFALIPLRTSSLPSFSEYLPYIASWKIPVTRRLSGTDVVESGHFLADGNQHFAKFNKLGSVADGPVPRNDHGLGGNPREVVSVA